MEKLNVPSTLKLLPYQQEGVRKMLNFLRTTGAVYNADEQGLGKSVQTIVTCNGLTRDYSKPIIVICPAVMRLVWKKEFELWSTESRVRVLKSSSEVPDNFESDVYIISYSLATSVDFLYLLNRKTIDILILDEAHYLKNSKAIRTKTILRKIWPKATYKIALSGTPFTQNVVDGYTLFHKMNEEAFPDYHSFANTYAIRKHNGFGIQYVGMKNAEQLRTIVTNSFFFRRLKSKVLTELGPKTFTQIPLDSSYAVKRSMDEALKEDKFALELEKLLNDPTLVNTPTPSMSYMELRREQGLKKVEPIVEYVKILLEQNVPVVLFCVFRDVLAAYEEAFSKYKPAIIHGDIGASARQQAIEDFQAGKTDLFIGQMQAAGVGITLTRSSNVVLAEVTGVPADIAQAVDRCHRIGQKDNVVVHYFVVEDSVEGKIIKMLVKRVNEFKQVLG